MWLCLGRMTCGRRVCRKGLRGGCGLVHDSSTQQAIKGRMMRAVALLGADEVSLNA